MDKALFIPLCTRWFRDFESGIKTVEYRAYGPRWNERTCPVGRKAVLAHGYGHPRLDRVVLSFAKIERTKAPKAAQDIFPKAEFIAAIGLRDPATA